MTRDERERDLITTLRSPGGPGLVWAEYRAAFGLPFTAPMPEGASPADLIRHVLDQEYPMSGDWPAVPSP